MDTHTHTHRRKHRLKHTQKRRHTHLARSETGTRAILETMQTERLQVKPEPPRELLPEPPRNIQPEPEPTPPSKPEVAVVAEPAPKPTFYSIFFPPDIFIVPGEYGKPDIDQGLSNGFAIVNHPKLDGQQIYISSLLFVKGLKRENSILETNHANLLSCDEFKSPVPEVKFSAAEGLKIFRKRLKKLDGVKGDIIINCVRGRNRSPVAALIYMVDRGIPYHEAYASLMASMRVRFKDFKLNPYNNYTASLEALEHASNARQRATAGISRSYSTPTIRKS